MGAVRVPRVRQARVLATFGQDDFPANRHIASGQNVGEPLVPRFPAGTTLDEVYIDPFKVN